MCIGVRTSKDFAATSTTGKLPPPVAHGMAIALAEQGLMRAAVSEFWNNDTTTVDQTLTALLQMSGSKRK